MRTSNQIAALLDDLNSVVADDLEGQDLDFKEWDTESRNHAIDLIIEMAVCMANGGGGTVVFGVKDNIVGRAKAILGVPLEIDPNILMKRVYDSTDPKITPIFEELRFRKEPGDSLSCKYFQECVPIQIQADMGKSAWARGANPSLEHFAAI